MMMRIDMKRSINIITLIITVIIFGSVFSLIYLYQIKDNGITRVEIAQDPDGKKNINVTVTLPQIKKEIAPIRIKEFLSRTKVANAEKGGLRLIDFEDNDVLARYGFKKGDIIKEIDGQSVNTTKDAIKVCDNLQKNIFKNKDAKEIKVGLSRDGEDINMNFRIPEFVPEKVCYTLRLEKRGKR